MRDLKKILSTPIPSGRSPRRCLCSGPPCSLLPGVCAGHTPAVATLHGALVSRQLTAESQTQGKDGGLTGKTRVRCTNPKNSSRWASWWDAGFDPATWGTSYSSQFKACKYLVIHLSNPKNIQCNFHCPLALIIIRVYFNMANRYT